MILDEHLLFQRRLCRNGVVLRVKEKRAGKVLCLAGSFAIHIYFRVVLAVLSILQTHAYLAHFHNTSESLARESGQMSLLSTLEVQSLDCFFLHSSMPPENAK